MKKTKYFYLLALLLFCNISFAQQKFFLAYEATPSTPFGIRLGLSNMFFISARSSDFLFASKDVSKSYVLEDGVFLTPSNPSMTLTDEKLLSNYSVKLGYNYMYFDDNKAALGIGVYGAAGFESWFSRVRYKEDLNTIWVNKASEKGIGLEAGLQAKVYPFMLGLGFNYFAGLNEDSGAIKTGTISKSQLVFSAGFMF